MAMIGQGFNAVPAQDYPAPCKPSPPHESAAQAWTSSRNRLDRAIEALNIANAELEEARKLEQHNWGALEDTAGRSQTKAQAGTMLPPGGVRFGP
jgi:hypothetical protein